jgi:hypothetical protein
MPSMKQGSSAAQIPLLQMPVQQSAAAPHIEPVEAHMLPPLEVVPIHAPVPLVVIPGAPPPPLEVVPMDVPMAPEPPLPPRS